MSRCYFCGSNYGFEIKVRFSGKKDGKRIQKTTYICPTCCAMADDRKLEKELDWDEGSLKKCRK